MVSLSVPGYGDLELRHLVLDYNGTLACDGRLLPGVQERLNDLAEHLHIHVVTADTFGKARSGLQTIPCELTVLPVQKQDLGKLAFVRSLGVEQTVCVGNGRNDRAMLKAAALGIAVILGEGAASDAVLHADVVCTSIVTALELLSHPLRLTATLRT